MSVGTNTAVIIPMLFVGILKGSLGIMTGPLWLVGIMNGPLLAVGIFISRRYFGQLLGV